MYATILLLETADQIQFMLKKLIQSASGKIRFGAKQRAAGLISAAICIVSLTLYWSVYIHPHSNPFLQFLAEY